MTDFAFPITEYLALSEAQMVLFKHLVLATGIMCMAGLFYRMDRVLFKRYMKRRPVSFR